MRISDWSSDVCSSDLLSLVCTDRPGLLADIAHVLRKRRLRVHDARIATFGESAEDVFRISEPDNTALDQDSSDALRDALLSRIDGEERKSVVEGKRVSVRVDFGERWIMKEKIKSKSINNTYKVYI